MSYCVNCGVELDSTIKKCPLCNTIVLNPNQLSGKEIEKLSPFPDKVGTVESGSKKDIAIVITVILACVAVCCILLNWLVWNPKRWSLLVIGFCGLLWMLVAPPLFIQNIRKRVMALINGLMICIYLWLIGIFSGSTDWVIELGLPITVTVLVLVEIILTVGKYKRSILLIMSLGIMEIGVLCMTIELLIERFVQKPLHLSWSAIVLTICVVITGALVAMLSRRGIRNEIDRRFHL